MPPASPSRRIVRAIASTAALGLSVTALSVVAAPSAQAAPVTIQLLNINDFHGRIDANTTKFATTIEQRKAANPNTLFLSAGDNVGASLFASSVQQDNPTIDVLNTLGLQTSAVGNHEFDKGAADLTGRIEPRATWDYLGANVYTKGTTTPALPEYKTFETGGVTVGVIGVVTQETLTAVSPAGIANLDFGDPVAAVNRVAAQLSDGNATNGEADVLVAEYHEGAEAGDAEGSDLATELARNGGDTAFNKIVTQTDPAVDAIFTGHTHAKYAWDAPITGSSATRPIVQTGSYGANIGQIELTVDSDTGAVSSYTKTNIARAAAEDLSLAKVAQVKTITDAALAESVRIGNQVVAKQNGDITTAFTGGAYSGAGGTYAGGTRDDRASESTLGNLVGEALLKGVTNGTPDFAVTNPGGLRAELLAKGDTSTYSLNTDGVITLAEAAAVLPFANTVSLVKMTGAQVKDLFEQQWPTATRTTTLRLGTSKNVRVTADPSAAQGNRVTSIRINGTLIDPAATYTVSTLNFLAAGGDGFAAFAQGTSTDVGLLDLDLFTDQLKKGSPVAPDYARHQVNVSGTLPATVSAGDQVNVGLSNLNLTSQGSPANTKVTAFAVAGTTVRNLGTFPVAADGTSTVALTVPADVAGTPGLNLIAEPSRTQVGAPLPTLASTTTASIPSKITFASPVTIPVTVDAPIGATGNVRLVKGTDVLARSDVAGGKATLELGGRVLKAGQTHGLKVEYVGDELVAASSTPVTQAKVKRAKAEKMKVTVKPKRIVAKRTWASVKVKLTPPANFKEVLGEVSVKAGGRTVRGKLNGNKVTIRVRPFGNPGTKTIKVKYLGSAGVAQKTEYVKVKVLRRR